MKKNILIVLVLCFLFAGIVYADPPAGVVNISPSSSGISDYALVSWPRYKIAFDGITDNNMWVIFGANGTVVDSYRTTDQGNTWADFGTNTWDPHSSIWKGSGNYLHIAGRDGANGIALYRRYNGSSWDNAITFNDYGGDASTAAVISVGDNVWFVERSSFGSTSPDNVYFRLSTDNGATFGAATSIVDPTNGVWHREGVFLLDGVPAAAIWDTEASYCTIKIYKWNGTTFAAIANNTLQTTSADAYTRQYSVTQTEDGTLHAVWWDIVAATNVLRHSYRTVAGTWSGASTVVSGVPQTANSVLTHFGNTVYLGYVYDNTTYEGLWYRSWTSGGGWSGATQLSSSADGKVISVNTAPAIPAGFSYLPFVYETQAGGGGPYRIRYRGIVVNDTTPAAFSFTNQTGVALGSTNNSDNATLTGFDNTTTLVLTGDASCKYSINGAEWATADDNVSVNDNVALQNVASGSYSTAVGCTLTVGGVANTGAPWTRTTLAAVSDPQAPRFRGASMTGGWR